MRRFDYVSVLLRLAVAFAFLYPPINAIWNPYSWLGYFPPWLMGYVPDEVLLHGFGLLEVIIAVWILSGWRIFWPSMVAAFMLAAIVVIDFYNFEVLFRDVSIALAALALAIMARDRERSTGPHIQ